jgi:hypothetical protein
MGMCSLAQVSIPRVFSLLVLADTNGFLLMSDIQFIENLIEEGTRSPRTIRLAALHLTGLWLSNPRIIKFYLKELKLLSLYGSGAKHEYLL